MYLIAGSTGLLGGEICRLLKKEGKSVRALVRATSNQDKLDGLQNCGAELIQGDLRERASLDEACQGARAVISTVSSMPFSYQPGENDIQTVDIEGQINLIDAAKAAGVKHFIYTSFTMDNDFPLRNAKRKVEAHLKASGLTYTILRAGYFMEVWLSPAVGFDAENAKAQIYGSGENPISWISFLDVAKFAVQCLDNPAAVNATFDLGGPEALTPLQTVKIFEQIGGKPFEVQHVPEEALAQQQQDATDPMQQSFTGLMRWVAKGDAIDMEPTLDAIPIELTSVKQYAQRVLVSS
jgi:NADH dehydrogenase